MATTVYLFTGSQPRVFPDVTFEGHTLLAEPGGSYALDANPDPAWFTDGSGGDAKPAKGKPAKS